MENKVCLFNENEISFIIDKNNKVMINATEMAKTFNKRIDDFMSNSNTKLFIQECLKSPELLQGKNGNSRFIMENEDNSFEMLKEEDLYISVQRTGTWMHRILALKFAAWLNPAFELWIYSTIEKLMFGKYVERESSLQRTLELERERNEIVENPNKTGEDFEKYLQIERLLKQEKAIRRNLTSESISEIKGLFDQ